MLNEALLFLIDVMIQPFAAILLLRFHLQWLRAPLRNPVGEFVMVLTDFVVLRTRCFIPSAWGFDSATLLLALLAETMSGLPSPFTSATATETGREPTEKSSLG